MIRKLIRLWYRFAPSFPVKRRVYDVVVFFDFRENPSFGTTPRKRLEGFESLMDHLPAKPCRIWDVGCNVGYFSLNCARRNHQVVAFDLSEKAIGLLERGLEENGLEVERVPRAFTPETTRYRLPASA
ncbi:MAG: methyltransferase, partial [Verrucomicrobiota bacterium]